MTGGGPLSTNGIEAGVKIRPTEQELVEMGPVFREGWNSYFKVHSSASLAISL